jgi:hypothetical protein
MQKLSSVLIAAGIFTAIAGAMAVPASAAPLHFAVHGAQPLIVLPDSFSNEGADWGDPYGAYGNPLDRYYDPAGKVPFTNYRGAPAVDLVLARTLDRNHESILGHMLTCQARYASYNPATNFYAGRHGIPQICYR